MVSSCVLLLITMADVHLHAIWGLIGVANIVLHPVIQFVIIHRLLMQLLLSQNSILTLLRHHSYEIMQMTP